MSGDYVSLPVTVRDNDDALVDLSGMTGVFKMARRANSTAVIESPTNATVTFTDASNGLVTVTIDDADTEALKGDYYYELKITDGSGREVVVARGWITALENLT